MNLPNCKLCGAEPNPSRGKEMTRQTLHKHLTGQRTTAVIHTSGHYGLAWFHTQAELDEWACVHLDSSAILYEGRKQRIPYQVAIQVGTLHPRYEAYRAATMMPLWHCGSTRQGSEDPVVALNWKISTDYKFIVIWQAYKMETKDDQKG